MPIFFVFACGPKIFQVIVGLVGIALRPCLG